MKDRIKDYVSEWKGLIICSCSLFIIAHFVFTLVFIPTSSMEPTIKAGSLGVAWRLPYLINEETEIKRGDIVCFWNKEQQLMLCKRVIGLPGDHVSFLNGDVYINGELLENDWGEEHSTFCSKEFEVPNGYFFYMGDNRLHSSDSRILLNPYSENPDIYARIICWIKLPKLLDGLI